MVLWELLCALTVASLLSAIFALANRKGVPRTGLFWLFLLIFLTTWAGGVWIRPFGPALRGVFWLPFLLVGVIAALFLLLTLNLRAPRNRHETIDMLHRIENEKKLNQMTYVTLSLVFWVLLIVLLLAVLLRYWPDTS